MILHCPTVENGFELLVDGVSLNFSYAPSDDNKASTRTLHTLFESYENSWGTMVTVRTPWTSAVKETSLLTSRRTSPQGSTKYLYGMGTRERATLWRCPIATWLLVASNYTNHLACRFRVTMTLNHCWFPSLLDSLTDISSPGSYNPVTLAGLAQA